MTHFKMALASNEQTSITFWKGSNFYNKSLKENKHVVAPILKSKYNEQQHKPVFRINLFLNPNTLFVCQLFTAIVKRIYAHRERMRRCNKEQLKHHTVSSCFLILHPEMDISFKKDTERVER